MGKASRRRRGATDGHDGTRRTRAQAPPFVARPFEGLPGETDWVALREIIPAGTASVRLAAPPDDSPAELTVATVLPLAWPALHRADGTVVVGTQTGSSTGDASRDLAQSLLAALEADPGTPVVSVPPATVDTPRLQELLDTTLPLEVTVHEGFDFWAGDSELDAEGQASLERANASVVPTTRLQAARSAYWCRIGQRTHVRLVLPEAEDVATDGLARLHAAGESGLGPETRLLGAFRTCGLLVPVWDLDPTKEPHDYEEPLGAFVQRYAVAASETEPLTAEERRARSGLLSRQVTLR